MCLLICYLTSKYRETCLIYWIWILLLWILQIWIYLLDHPSFTCIVIVLCGEHVYLSDISPVNYVQNICDNLIAWDLELAPFSMTEERFGHGVLWRELWIERPSVFCSSAFYVSTKCIVFSQSLAGMWLSFSNSMSEFGSLPILSYWSIVVWKWIACMSSDAGRSYMDMVAFAICPIHILFMHEIAYGFMAQCP